ncbi:MAG TPA: acetate--CoA ligase family protein [Longimicrobiales bacterium]|nr:acetate--CoA ligase family protein [Longimicrobiales bacterium]
MNDSNVTSIEPIFRPRSVAVIGASRTPGTVGYEIIHNLLVQGFSGAVYPVNPKATSVHSVPAYAGIEDVPAPVDLAVITVPKQHTLAVAEACGRHGVRALVVITAGFKEVGGAGIEREHELLAIAHRYGMRMIGPNCLGVVNTAADISMNATFAPIMPPPGPVSFMSQSGAMGVTILDYAAEYGIGVNHFVSVGNKADVSGNDLIEFWADDPATRVILMYLENFGNPRKFTRIARQVTKSKPVIAVKAGRTAAGARAASSHTGALAGMDSATDALLAQCGVLRVDTVEQLFDMAMAFGHLPVPEGNRVAVVTNAGGPGIIITDSCEANGLSVAELSPKTQSRLRQNLPDEASVRNPVDMIATATPESYRLALEAVLADPNIDAAIAAFVPPLRVRQQDVARSIVAARRKYPDKPMLAVLMGRAGLPEGRAELRDAGVPAYIFPESAARALAAMFRYRQWLERPVGQVSEFEVRRDEVARILDRATGAGGGYLSRDEVLQVLDAYGIATLQSGRAATPGEAAAVAAEMGYPVVLKVDSADIIHKTDVGGVLLDLRDEDAVRSGFKTMMERVRARHPDAQIDGVTIERFVRGGRETIIGVSQDPSFGPVIMFGLGGIYVEALKDVTFRVQPVTDVDAHEMVRAIRGFSLLEGMRGEAASDLAALEEVIQRVSQLVGDHPRVLELDINPFVVFEEGGVAVDARIRVAGTEADQPAEPGLVEMTAG